MPSSAEAEEDKRRKVSGSAAPPQFLERPSALIQNPGTHPDTDADLLHPTRALHRLLSSKSRAGSRLTSPRSTSRREAASWTCRKYVANPITRLTAPRVGGAVRVFPAFGARKRLRVFLAACNRLTRRPESIPRESSLPGRVRRPRLLADRHDRAHHLRTPVRHGVRNSVRGVGSETRRRREHDAAA